MPSFKAVLVFRWGIGPAASFWLLLHDVIILLSRGPSSPKCVFWLEVVDAFVARLFYRPGAFEKRYACTFFFTDFDSDNAVSR